MTENEKNHGKDIENSEENKKHDPFSRITGGLILILLGVLFLLVTLDYLSWGDWWPYFLIGLGVIFILEGIIRSTSPSYREHVTGKFIAGLVLIVIGSSFIVGLSNWWPLIIIAVGVIVLISPLWRKK